MRLFVMHRFRIEYCDNNIVCTLCVSGYLRYFNFQQLLFSGVEIENSDNKCARCFILVSFEMEFFLF